MRKREHDERRDFRTEAGMTEIVCEWLRGRGYYPRCEVQTICGPCDIVARPSSHIPRKQIPRLDSLGARVLDLFRSLGCNSLSSDNIRKRIGKYLSTDELEQALQRLVDLRLMEVRRHRFVPSQSISQFCDSLLAVELKLERFSDVVRQASNNRCFAARSVVALPASRVSKLRGHQIASVSELGLGLLSVDPSGKCSYLIEAREQPELLDHALVAVVSSRLRRYSAKDISTSTDELSARAA